MEARQYYTEVIARYPLDEREDVARLIAECEYLKGLFYDSDACPELTKEDYEAMSGNDIDELDHPMSADEIIDWIIKSIAVRKACLASER